MPLVILAGQSCAHLVVLCTLKLLLTYHNPHRVVEVCEMFREWLIIVILQWVTMVN